MLDQVTDGVRVRQSDVRQSDARAAGEARERAQATAAQSATGIPSS